jgi:hypothetical protein
MRDAHIRKRCPLVMGNNSNTILAFRMASKWFAPTIFSTIDGVRVLSVIHSEHPSSEKICLTNISIYTLIFFVGFLYRKNFD